MVSIAIDGPSGAGKSTLARMLAQHLEYLYVDTGALYRTVGIAALRQGVNPKNEAAVAALLPQLELSLVYKDGAQRMQLCGEDVTEQIRQERVGMAASDVSAHGAVREWLLSTQRSLAQHNNVVMDGRDIGTVVLPAAEIKIFLTADVEKRAARRWKELQDKGSNASYETVLQDIKNRDHNDTNRPIAPLKQAEDAALADTTELDLQQSFELLLRIAEEKLQGGSEC